MKRLTLRSASDFFLARDQTPGICRWGLVCCEHMFDSVMERQVLPGDLELIAPGPFLAAILSGIDRSMLSGHDAVRVMTW